MKDMTEKEQRLFYIQSEYDMALYEWTHHKRGASYGELYYIQTLDNEGLNELENDLVEYFDTGKVSQWLFSMFKTGGISWPE